MTLQSTFLDLAGGLQDLESLLSSLLTAVAEDRPTAGETVLVDLFSDGLEDLAEILKSAILAATLGQSYAVRSGDLSQSCRALIDCQHHFNAFFVRLSSDLTAYERLAALDSLSEEQGEEWGRWAQEVKYRLGQCHHRALELLLQMAATWEELGDRLVPAISLQAVSIVQHSVPGK